MCCTTRLGSLVSYSTHIVWSALCYDVIYHLTTPLNILSAWDIQVSGAMVYYIMTKVYVVWSHVRSLLCPDSSTVLSCIPTGRMVACSIPVVSRQFDDSFLFTHRRRPLEYKVFVMIPLRGLNIYTAFDHRSVLLLWCDIPSNQTLEYLKRLRYSSVWLDGISHHNKSTERWSKTGYICSGPEEVSLRILCTQAADACG